MGEGKTKRNWVAPQVVVVSGTPEAWGHCVSGSTPIATGTMQGCYNGQSTASGGSNNHNCGTGGVVGGTACNTGSAVLVGNPSTGCVNGAAASIACTVGNGVT